MANNTKNIMIVGVGGQGTLLTSRILGGITVDAGYDVNLLPFKSTQGDFVIITDTSSFATSSFTILSSSLISKAFTSTTFLIPKDLQSW